MPQLKKGILISIEGIDGSGKSTLSKNLARLLYEKGHDAILTKEPGDTSLGKKIRELVQQKDATRCPTAEFLLFAADRAQHFEELIIPALNQKKIVISDRLADSSVAYQGYGRELDMHNIQTVNQWAMNNIQPDITLFVKVPVEIALERVNKRNETITLFEKKELLEKVAHGFEALYKNRTDVLTLNGEQTIEELTQQSYTKLDLWMHQNNLF